ncbi:MAG TPA: ABC transporter ATP-binding protein [Anaerolineae bacterium]|nr:ABC transporter ATP-binding protein [Anaerolineae bacterium]
MTERIPLLSVDNLIVSYDQAQVLHGISLHVDEGETVAILGANGAGKSTLMKTLIGWLRPRQGRIEFAGEDITPLPPWERAIRGLALVPEGGRVFPEMSVEENLRLGAYLERDRKALQEGMERVFALFPVLAERRRQRAGTLSGGERQMLSIGRAVMRKPRLLLVDEISMGLAPMLVEAVFGALRELREQGVSLLLVEQNAHEALQIVERGYVLENGHIVLEAPADELRRNPKVQAAYLGGM